MLSNINWDQIVTLVVFVGIFVAMRFALARAGVPT